MKKFKSKKAYTLIELVVTIAIMLITAGMGVGIFVSTMSNYSTASVLSSEQQRATEIEEFIFRYARVCKSIYFIDGAKSDTLVDGTHYLNSVDELVLSTDSSQYIKMEPGSNFAQYVSNDRDDVTGDVVPSPIMSVEGVDNMIFSISKQKVSKNASDEDAFLYLNYTINMVGGYSVSGTVVMNNCENVQSTSGGGYDDSYVEDMDGEEFVVGEDEFYTRGVGFLTYSISSTTPDPG